MTKCNVSTFPGFPIPRFLSSPVPRFPCSPRFPRSPVPYFKDSLFTTRGPLYSLLCDLYADIFDYFWKTLLHIKLRVSDFYL